MADERQLQLVHCARSQSLAFLAPDFGISGCSNSGCALIHRPASELIFKLLLPPSKRKRILGWSQRGPSAFRPEFFSRE